MELKPGIKRQLQTARGYSESLLKAFKTPQDWLHQVHPKANHPLWFAGHMGVTDNFFVSLISPGSGHAKPGYPEKFGPGSHPTSNPADYPPVEEVLAYMRDRRETLLKTLDELSEEDLQKPTPKRAPDFLRTLGDVFQMSSWHEGLHSGQVSVVHRALGHPPVAGG